MDDDSFISELNQKIAGLTEEINSLNKKITPILKSENQKIIERQAQSFANLKIEFERAGKTAFDIAKNPEENLTNENYGLIYSLAKVDSFWEQRSDIDNAITGWFHSLRSKQQKNFEEFLFGKERKWTIKEVYAKLFKSGSEDWEGISNAFYQEAVWAGYLVDKLNSDASKNIFSTDESYFLPTQINNERLKDLIKQRQKSLDDLAKAKKRSQQYKQDKAVFKALLLKKPGITDAEAEGLARNLAKRGLSSDEAHHEIDSYQVQGSNAVDSNLRRANPDAQHSSAPKRGNNSEFQSKQTKGVLAGMERLRGTYKSPVSRLAGSFAAQLFGSSVRNAQRNQASQDSQARQDGPSREESVSRSSRPNQNSNLIDGQTRAGSQNNQSNAGTMARSSSGQQIGASLGVLGKLAGLVKGFAKKKAIAAVLAAIPTGVSQAIALALLLKDRLKEWLKKIPLVSKFEDLWSWVKRLVGGAIVIVILEVGKLFGWLVSLVSGGGPIGATSSAAIVGVAAPGTSASFFGLGASSTPVAAGGGGASGFGAFMASASAPPVIASVAVCCATIVTVTTIGAAMAQQEINELYEAPKFTVTKEIVSVNGAPITNNAIPNIGETSTNVTYKVTFTSQGEPISLSVPTDKATSYKSGRDSEPIKVSENINFPTRLEANESKSVTLNVILPANSDRPPNSEQTYDDSRLVNTISVYGTVDKEEKPTGQTQTASVSLKIGNPIDGQPFGMPIAGHVNTLDYDVFEKQNGGCKSLSGFPPYTHCGEFLGMLVAGGLDIGGTGQVVSTVNGTVTQSSFDDSLDGLRGVVVISTESHEYQVAFMHLAKDGLPNVGDQISRGQPIGTVSKDYYGGAHVHYQILRDGQNYPFAQASAGNCSDGDAIMSVDTKNKVSTKGTLTIDDVATIECK